MLPEVQLDKRSVDLRNNSNIMVVGTHYGADQMVNNIENGDPAELIYFKLILMGKAWIYLSKEVSSRIMLDCWKPSTFYSLLLG